MPYRPGFADCLCDSIRNEKIRERSSRPGLRADFSGADYPKSIWIPTQHYCLAITLPPENKVIGHVSLTSQNPDILEWEIGWAVQCEDWGKGYATEAAYLMLEFGFDQLRAHRVVAFCHAENAASVKVMKKSE